MRPNPSSTPASKRLRPLLGTTVRLEADGAEPGLFTEVFDEIERLQGVFNFHDPTSQLALFNRKGETPRSPEFAELWQICKVVSDLAPGYFIAERDGQIDFSGIAKGFIVDRAMSFFRARAPGAKGCVNAGGDLGFFGGWPARVHLRLGEADRAYAREFQLSRPCLASSSIQGFNERTRYSLRPVYGAGATAVVQAPSVAVADAMTKVVLFAPASVTGRCCEALSATAMCFDVDGNLLESFVS